MGGNWASTPTQDDLPFLLDWSFEHQFNSSLHTLSETGKWVLLMWGVGHCEEQKSHIKLQNWKVAYRCGLLLHNCNSNKMGPFVTFSGIKEKFFDLSTFVYICLQSSSDSCRLVYFVLVTRLHSSSDSSTIVYIRLWLVYIRLHLSTLV